jgi:hypothetical protein
LPNLGGEEHLIDDDFLDSLPDDPEEAFLLLESRLRREADTDVDNGFERSESAWRRYLIELDAFVDARNVNFAFDLDHYLPTITNTFWQRLQEFDQLVQIYIAKGRHRRAAARRGAAPAFVVLDVSDRRKASQYINKIRELVDASDISDTKKQAIRARLAELQSELDREKTRAEAAFATYLTVKREMGKAGEGVVQLLDKIVTVLAKAKPLIEAIKGPTEPKKLPAPPKKKQPERQEESSGSFDDEIPF